MNFDRELLVDLLGEEQFTALSNISFADLPRQRERFGFAVSAICRAVFLASQAEEARRLAYPGLFPAVPSAIPKRIMQFWDKPEVPQDVGATMKTWSDKTLEGYEYVRFDDERAHAYVKDNYGAEIASLYEYAHHPAMKADMFRIAYLYKEGGTYVDADDECSGTPLWPDLDPAAKVGLAPLFWDIRANNLIVPKQRLAHAVVRKDVMVYLNNAPICAVPGAPFMHTWLELIVHNISRAKRNGERVNIHDETGPGLLSAYFVLHVLKNGYGNATPDKVRMICNWDLVINHRWHAYKGGGGHWSQA